MEEPIAPSYKKLLTLGLFAALFPNGFAGDGGGLSATDAPVVSAAVSPAAAAASSAAGASAAAAASAAAGASPAAAASPTSARRFKNETSHF